MEQLGYQAESGLWRNACRTAVLELRNGNSADISGALSDGSILWEITSDMIFDYMSIVFDKQAFADVSFTVNVLRVLGTGNRHIRFFWQHVSIVNQKA